MRRLAGRVEDSAMRYLVTCWSGKTTPAQLEELCIRRYGWGMSFHIAPNEDVMPTPGQPTIKEVRAYVSRNEEYGASNVHDTHWIMGLSDAQGG